MKHIVSQEWLFEHGNDADIVIVDCRFALGQPSSGKDAYEQDHIPGAYYLDLEKDMSGPKEPHGGRHPLPNIDEFAAKLSRIGIDDHTTVVAYDDQGGAMASRLWWILKYLGHDDVYVLDGGYAKWKQAGYPTTDEPPLEHPTAFKPQVRKEMLARMEDVKARIGRAGTVIIDSREAKRYLGLEEPIDPVAGHVPSARNYFWKDSLDSDGNWLPGEQQAARFSGLKDAEEIIVYCGSGVTACPNVLALSEAGLQGVKLYSGSWSDWISYKENPIATGEEK
jgi:thiosulfate/3-mercaptopyruvate sulfurtransferase